MMTFRPTGIASAVLILSLSLAVGQDKEEEEAGTLGGLLKKVTDIKVPESVSNLPAQITELKEAYLETAKTVEDLRIEVDTLRDEVYALQKQNEELSKAVGVKVEEDHLTALMKPEKVSATDLVERYSEDKASADERYRGKYLSVVGSIAEFKAGTNSIEIFLNAERQDSRVRCEVPTGNDLFVDVLPSQGRLVSRNDRRPLLSIGQPVTIVGTCTGASLNVDLANCRIDGLVEKKIEKPEPENKK